MRVMSTPFRTLPLWTAAALLCATLAGCGKKAEANPASWQSLPPETGIKMLAYTTEFVKISPRDAGTLNASRSSRWIAQEIRRMGLTPQADAWTETTAFGKKTFCNLYVDIPGETDSIVLFGSHYDTKPGISESFQGANDGGSSTGILLGLIDHFVETKPKLRNTIRFAFFDGEEAQGNTYRDDDGLQGSKRMALAMARASIEKPVVAVIVLDMVGDQNLKLEIPRNVTPWLAKIAIQESSANPHAAPVSLASTAIIDDHLPFIVNRFAAIDLIDFEYGSAEGKHDYWHTEKDTIDKISPESLFKSATLALSMLARIEDGTGLPTELQPIPETAKPKPQ